MISTISAYKEIIPASSVVTPGQQLRAAAGRVASSGKSAAPADALERSVSHDVFTAVDSYFNMGKSGRFDAFHALSPEDKEQFVKIVAELAKSGYMGYEELIVNKKVEKHDVLNQMGDDRLHDAKVYDRPKIPRR
jgi:hypothetical protein